MVHQWEILRRLPRPECSPARAQAARECTTPVHEAATVVLVDDSTNGVRVWMMQRASTMAFAAGAWVFPGGRLEEHDRVPDPVRAAAVREVEEETGLRLDPEELRPWMRWTTPPGHPRRYDTHFFVAPAAGRQPGNPSTEAEIARWWAPADLLDSGETLFPPTRAVLLELADHSTWESVRSATVGRVIAGFTPRIEERDGTFRFTYPDETGTWT